jgi:hypothetical protein
VANVFISHRRADYLEAEKLATEIRNAGHNAWLDDWNIGLGDSIVGRMNEGLDAADYVVLCYSSSGVDSEWISREWMSALARQLNGAGIKLIPALLTGGGPPAILADIYYADLVKDWPRGLAMILKALK